MKQHIAQFETQQNDANITSAHMTPIYMKNKLPEQNFATTIRLNDREDV